MFARKVRWRLSTMLIAIALLAVPLGGLAWRHRQGRLERLRSLSATYNTYAARHRWGAQRSGQNLNRALYQQAVATKRQEWSWSMRDYAAASASRSEAGTSAKEAAYQLRLQAWHTSLGQKYALAAQRPWQAVKPDPPKPLPGDARAWPEPAPPLFPDAVLEFEKYRSR
jgi:hypothetical protein